MIFTSEAIYALHMLNDEFADLFHVPFPKKEGEEQKQLKEVLEKGYKDLEQMGLIIDNDPTDVCINYGYILHKYHKAKRYMLVNHIACAVDVDKNKLFTHVIERVGENEYRMERVSKMILLAVFHQNIKFLQILDDKHQTDDTKLWHDLALFRLKAYYHHNEAIKLEYFEYGKCTYSCLVIDNDTELIEYDLTKEKARTMSGKMLKKQLIKFMKVQV